MFNDQNMVKFFDFNKLSGLSYEERHKNVLYETDEFKIRIVDLPENESLPECDMATHVILVVLQGHVDVTIYGVVHHLSEKQSLVSEPALFSMHSQKGAKLMGIQIKKQRGSILWVG